VSEEELFAEKKKSEEKISPYTVLLKHAPTTKLKYRYLLV
jgi:hypothetical protein